MHSFENVLRELRAREGLTQKEMARRIAVPLRTYQNYEAGKYRPQSAEVYARLAGEFGLSVDDILEGTLPFETGAKARLQSTELLKTARGLFSGGALSEEDKDFLMQAISDAYWQAKRSRNDD